VDTTTLLSRSVSRNQIRVQTADPGAHDSHIGCLCFDAQQSALPTASYIALLQDARNCARPRNHSSLSSCAQFERLRFNSCRSVRANRMNELSLKICQMQTGLMIRALGQNGSGPLGDLLLIASLAILAAWRATEFLRGLRRRR
jgi:hypothetical protein